MRKIDDFNYVCILGADTLLAWLEVIRKDTQITFSTENKRFTARASGMPDLILDPPGVVGWDIQPIKLDVVFLREALAGAVRGDRVKMMWNKNDIGFQHGTRGLGVLSGSAQNAATKNTVNGA